MDLRRLRYFVTLAEYLNFHKAAVALNTSQPSLSQQIRLLEREVGVDLLERDTHRVRLTNAGIEYLAGVKDVIVSCDAAAGRARAAKEGVRGRLQIATSGLMLIDHLPQVILAYRETYPDVDVSVSVARSPDLIAALERGSIDIALSNTQGAGSHIATEELWSFALHVVLPRTHRYARRSSIALRELNGETLIIHPRRLGGGGANGIVMSVCREQGFVPGAVHEVPEVGDLEALVGLVACGMGVTLLPSEFAKLSWPRIVFVPLDTEGHITRISACRRKDDRSALVQQFIATARSYAAEPNKQSRSVDTKSKLPRTPRRKTSPLASR